MKRRVRHGTSRKDIKSRPQENPLKRSTNSTLTDSPITVGKVLSEGPIPKKYRHNSKTTTTQGSTDHENRR